MGRHDIPTKLCAPWQLFVQPSAHGHGIPAPLYAANSLRYKGFSWPLCHAKPFHAHHPLTNIQPSTSSQSLNQSVLSWNCMIKRFLQQGQCQEVFKLFEEMPEKGVTGDKVTYISIISACASYADIYTGRVIHALVVDMALESDVTMANALIKLYGKCDSVEDSQCMFDHMPERSLVSWNTMIAVYAWHLKGNVSFMLFDRMQNESLLPDAYTFSSTISACTSQTALVEGVMLHARTVGSRFKFNLVVGNALVHMYGKCNSPENARRMFEAMPERNIVSWNAVIAVCAQHGHGKEALHLFDCMKREGIMPDKISFISLLSACAEGLACTECEHFHDLISASGFGSDTAVGNALINMYSKQGSLENARKAFTHMSDWNLISWNTLITAYAQHGQGNEVVTLFYQMQQEGVLPDQCTIASILSACSNTTLLPKGEQLHSLIASSRFELDVFVRNTLLNMYGKCGNVEMARKLFDEMFDRNVVSWNAMIAAYAQHGHGLQALQLFVLMWSEGVLPDKMTFVSILSACSSKVPLRDCLRMHTRIVGCDFVTDIYTQNSLVNMYGKQGILRDASVIFNEIRMRDVVTWNALISAYGQCGQGKVVLQLFNQMLSEAVLPVKVTYISILSSCAAIGAVIEGEQIHARIVFSELALDMMIENALVNMYGECGCLDNAQRIFDKMPNHNVISWNVIIAAYVHNGQGKEAFHLFDTMQEEGVLPDETTFTTILASVTGERGLSEGQIMHANAVTRGWELDVSVGNALLSMYGKCGDLVDARKIFDTMNEQNLVSWNSVITAYAQHGKAKEALHLFGQMKQGVIKPNDVTFMSVLSACNHAGMVDEGCCQLSSMFHDYGMNPAVDHYHCIFDLLGRAGRLDQLEGLIKDMPFKTTSFLFMSSLGASKNYAKVE